MESLNEKEINSIIMNIVYMKKQVLFYSLKQVIIVIKLIECVFLV